MPVLFKYSWFFLAVVMAANLLIWHRSLAIVVDRGRATRAEVDALLR